MLVNAWLFYRKINNIIHHHYHLCHHDEDCHNHGHHHHSYHHQHHCESCQCHTPCNDHIHHPHYLQHHFPEYVPPQLLDLPLNSDYLRNHYANRKVLRFRKQSATNINNPMFKTNVIVVQKDTSKDVPRNGYKNLPFKADGRTTAPPNSFNETKNIQRISEKSKEDANKMFKMALAIRTIRLKHMKANNFNTN